MLRFSYYRSDGSEDWRLWGRLAGPWVDDLRSVWRRIREHTPRVHSTVDSERGHVHRRSWPTIARRNAKRRRRFSCDMGRT
jgi:hypothetical protein